MHSIRNARTSTLIAAYRKEPAFPGDITWEMAIAVMPFDKRPCHVLWDEDTVRYHIAPFRTAEGEIKWLPYCQEGARYWGSSPIFLVGLGISKYSEEEIWEIVNQVHIRPRESLQAMYKDWVWDVLPDLAEAEAIYPRYGPGSGYRAGIEQPVMNMLDRPVGRCKNGVFSWRF